jgi:hypothetical protein
MIAEELANLGDGRPKKETSPNELVSQSDAAKMMSVSVKSGQRAAEVKKKVPALAKAVKEGKR